MAKKRKKRAKKGKKRAKQTRSFFRLIIILLALVVAAYFGYHILNPGGKHDVIKTRRHAKTARRKIKLFVAKDEGLKGLRRSIKKGTLKSEISETFTILQWADNGNIIPRGTKLLGVRIEGSTAYLNINSAISLNHPGGTSTEMQTIYSIVNSITLNYPAIKRVQLLIDGKRQKTLAGHIDISVPIGPYRGIIQKY